MKHIIKGLALASLLCVGAGCDDIKFGNAFLEKPLSDEMNMDSVFGNKIYAEQQLAQVYHSLPDHTPINGRLSWGSLESITDLGTCRKSGGTDYHKGQVTASNYGGAAYRMDYGRADGKFSAIYGIRQAHIFLENVDRVPDMTEEEKTRRKGEAEMIIAYHNVDIFRNYGGMPWIDHAYKPSDDLKMTRMTIAEAVEKICALIDDAASKLPWDVEANDDGRMTKAGALALKSRFLTFAASPLFNSDQPFKDGEASQSHYTWWGDYQQSRWQDALEAGLAFLRENAKNNNVYKLVDNGDPRKSFCSGYFDRYNHETLISSHRYIKWDLNTYNVTQTRYGTGDPTMWYCDMFPMKDGSDFSWDNPIHRAHPFFTEDFEMTRDPRLYETLIVTGDKFWGRKAEIYKGGREQPKDMGGGQNWRWADMGYFGIGLRKYYQDHLNELQNKFYNCCLLRLPEIYLNIAEAMNELGKAEQKDEFGRDAYDYINLLRDRVQMPHVTKETAAPGVALREAILRERALEFGYEEVRYYDINRWKHSDYLKARKIVRLRTFPEGEKVNGQYVNFTYELKEQSPNQHIWIDQWDDKYYLCPIPLDEINKKYGLVQNPGWE